MVWPSTDVGLGTGGVLLLATSSIAFFTKTLLTWQLNKQRPESTLAAKGNQGWKEGITMKTRSILNSIAEITKAIGVSVIANVLTARPCNVNLALPQERVRYAARFY